MGFHDKLARNAYHTGRRAADFAKAARSNARAVWLYVIVGMAIWWFGGGKWALIPGAMAVWSAISTVLATLVQPHLERLEASIERASSVAAGAGSHGPSSSSS